ncbi:MAG: hypothetical protein R3300_14055, partial [Candidatus Promineifilaceae bacterium]|nr:hypothetical protein [Candidatus Promineifilaceae bacterium]
GQMAERLQNPQELLPLEPTVFNILLALSDEAKHDYGIMLEMEANPRARCRWGPGTLYGSIKRMLKAGLSVKSDKRADLRRNDRSRYCKPTGLEQRALRLEAERLAARVLIARSKDFLRNKLSWNAPRSGRQRIRLLSVLQSGSIRSFTQPIRPSSTGMLGLWTMMLLDFALSVIGAHLHKENTAMNHESLVRFRSWALLPGAVALPG